MMMISYKTRVPVVRLKARAGTRLLGTRVPLVYPLSQFGTRLLGHFVARKVARVPLVYPVSHFGTRLPINNQPVYPCTHPIEGTREAECGPTR